jgi:cellulose synthase/poly-beta-1,6-N-acetylglucosamine synthase-like glycosyltransferase
LNIFDYSLLHQILLSVLAGSFILQLIYWWIIHARVIYHRSAVSRIRRFPVSVIICARNEEENLRNNLPLVLEQDYPEFEVIVVNDASADKTEEVLRDMKLKYPHLRTSNIEANLHRKRGKKLALTIGLKAARHAWVLLTDADCKPAGKEWLGRMQRNFTEDTGIVLGYGPYEHRKGLLNLVIRYDSFFIALQYFGYALAGFPYMGVGRNLAYRKKLFFDNKGFASHYDLDSGDDDLFINEVTRETAAKVELAAESYTFSEPESSWKNWYYQKKRHLTTGPRYNTLTKFLLGLEIMSRLAFYASFAAVLFYQLILPVALGIFILRMLSTIVIIKLAMSRLRERYLLLISPLLDIILPLVHIYMVFSNYVAGKRARWS